MGLVGCAQHAWDPTGASGVWIQLQGGWEMIECTPSASVRQCTQQ